MVFLLAFVAKALQASSKEAANNMVESFKAFIYESPPDFYASLDAANCAVSREGLRFSCTPLSSMRCGCQTVLWSGGTTRGLRRSKLVSFRGVQASSKRRNVL